MGALRIARGSADRWEIRCDNGAFTPNELQPGIAQIGHDLETVAAGAATSTGTRCRTQQRHSYEARVFGGGVIWAYGACPNCARSTAWRGTAAC